MACANTLDNDSADDGFNPGKGYVNDGCPAVGAAESSVTPVAAIIDSDRDGWSDLLELYIRADPTDPCAANTGGNNDDNDRWPYDLNDDKAPSLTDVSLFNAPVKKSAAGNYDRRLDLNGDGSISLTDIGLLNTVKPGGPRIPPLAGDPYTGQYKDLRAFGAKSCS